MNFTKRIIIFVGVDLFYCLFSLVYFFFVCLPELMKQLQTIRNPTALYKKKSTSELNIVSDPFRYDGANRLGSFWCIGDFIRQKQGIINVINISSGLFASEMPLPCSSAV